MRPLLGALLVGALFLAGCSSDEGATGVPGGGSDGGAAVASGGDSGQLDAGSREEGASRDSSPSDVGESPEASDGGGGDADSGSGDSGFAAKAGYIGVVSRATEVATVFANSVNAGFFDGPGYSYPKGCQREVIGACQVLLCDYTNGGDQTPPPGAVQSAGTLTVGGTAPTFSVEYNAATMQYGAVPAVPSDKILFTGGNTITFAAAGADVPAFADSIVAPAPLVVTSPALPSGTLSIDTSKDLAFAWTGASVGMLAFNIRTNTLSATTASSSFVSCQFAASALGGTVPAALLQKLRKTDATTTAILGTDLSSTKEVVAGDHMVHLAVGSVATTADGKTPYAATQVTIF